EGVVPKPPPLRREPGRLCQNRKRSWDEMDSTLAKKPRRCSTCGGTKHNAATCKGGEVGSNPKKKKVRVECDVNGSSFTTTVSAPKKIPTGTKIRRTRFEKQTTPKKSKSAASSSSAVVAKTGATSSAGTKKKGKHATSAVKVSINNMNKGSVKQIINNINFAAGSKRQRKPKVHFDV
ncbi:hypothetical protein MKW94_003664, partial [Papaver nudicaule]|nr:hypothetical protein [Papaver nudicaule]